MLSSIPVMFSQLSEVHDSESCTMYVQKEIKENKKNYHGGFFVINQYINSGFFFGIIVVVFSQNADP